MKTIVFFSLLIFMSLTGYSQSKDTIPDSLFQRMRKNELAYRFIGSVTYSRLFYNKKVTIGIGASLGPGFYWVPGPAFYDLIQLRAFTRNAFAKKRMNRIYDYDLGAFVTVGMAPDQSLNSYWGLYMSNKFNVFRWMNLGMEIYFGGYNIIGESGSEFPKAVPSFSPIITFTF